MTKFLHLIIAIIFAPTYLFSETVIIYATQSAQYSANDCCTLNILTNQNNAERVLRFIVAVFLVPAPLILGFTTYSINNKK